MSKEQADNIESPRIIASEFVLSAASPKQFLSEDMPEFAFVGRSNVGKSSLLNVLCNRKQLARTSKTPGRTQLVNYFRVTVKAAEKREALFVDLPGYGFAKVSASKQKSWAPLIESFLTNATQLECCFVLVDARRGIEEEERWFLEHIPSEHLLLVVTKGDKLSNNELKKVLDAIYAEGVEKQHVVVTSAQKKNLPGNRQLLKEIWSRL